MEVSDVLENKGLVEHCLMVFGNGWRYVYGTYGLILTESHLALKQQQYPNQINKYIDFIKSECINKRTVDCVGFIKSYLWWNIGDVKYDAATDTSANGMYYLSVEKGKISSMPEILGLCLWKNGHVGVYIGQGKVIEARGTKEGVICCSISDNTWSHWFKCPYITYPQITWEQIIDEFADHPVEWKTAIKVLKNAAKADGNLGSLEIFKYLPDLLEKIYNK